MFTSKCKNSNNCGNLRCRQYPVQMTAIEELTTLVIAEIKTKKLRFSPIRKIKPDPKINSITVPITQLVDCKQ